MITGLALLVWGIGITLLAFNLQTKIQEGTEYEWRQARDLYDRAPIIFCLCMAVSLAFWPLVFIYVMYKSFAKGTKHGN